MCEHLKNWLAEREEEDKEGGGGGGGGEFFFWNFAKQKKGERRGRKRSEA